MVARLSPIHTLIDPSLLDLISGSILYDLAGKKTQMLPMYPTMAEVEAYRRDNLAEIVWRRLLKANEIPFVLLPHPSQIARTKIGARQCLPFVLSAIGTSDNSQMDPVFSLPVAHPMADRCNSDALAIFCSTTSQANPQLDDRGSKWATWQFSDLATPLPRNGGNLGFELVSNRPATVIVEGLNHKLELVKEELRFTETVRVRHSSTVFTQLRVVHCTETSPPALIVTFNGAKLFSIRHRQWFNFRGMERSMTVWGYISVGELRHKLNLKMDSDTEYRIQVYQTGHHTLSGLELKPVSQLFGSTKILDK